MFTFILQLSLGIMAVSTLLYVIRVIKGPTIPDRVVALDGIGINLIAMTALVSILLNTSAFFGHHSAAWHFIVYRHDCLC